MDAPVQTRDPLFAERIDPRRWELWRANTRVVAWILLVDAAAWRSVVTGLVHRVSAADLARWLALALLGVVSVEVSVQLERRRRLLIGPGAHADLSAVWSVAGVLILPLDLALLLVIGGQALIWVRIWSKSATAKPYLAVYGTSCLLLTCAATHTLLSALGLPGLGLPADSGATVVLLAVAALTYAVVGIALTAIAIRLATGSREPRVLFGSWADRGLSWTTICIGEITALCVGYQPLLVVLILPVLLLAERTGLIGQLRTAASTDAKTGLLNAAAWRHDAQRELNRCTRSGLLAAVLVIDLDHFKQVNDRHGHIVGDRVLKAAADCLTQRLRDYDVLGRYGGEEFLVLLPASQPQVAMRIAQRLRLSLHGITIQDCPGLVVRASIGIATRPLDGDTLDSLIQAADVALFRAKGLGRDTVWPADGTARALQTHPTHLSRSQDADTENQPQSDPRNDS